MLQVPSDALNTETIVSRDYKWKNKSSESLEFCVSFDSNDLFQTRYVPTIDENPVNY